MTNVDLIPKVELHCHTDQLLDPSMLADLLGSGADPGIRPEELARRYPFESVESWISDYADFVAPHLEPIAVWHPLLIERHVARLRAQRVSYTELFISGWLAAFPHTAALVEAFRELRHRVNEKAGPGLQVEFVVCIGRGPPEKLERQFPRIAALRGAGLICGVALAGAEADYRVRPVERFFDGFRDLGLGIEIHAGEFAGPESVWDALQYGGPTRLGHAVAAFQDDALIDTLVERRIHVEFCPTSNLRLGVVTDIEQHPLGKARDLGVEFSINTDDPGPFECSLNSEFDLVRRTFGFSASDFDNVFESSMRARFADLSGTQNESQVAGAV